MICPTDKINSAINSGCPDFFGMEHNGYLTLRSELLNKSISEVSVSFIPGGSVIPVYQPIQDISFKPKSEGEKNAYGLTKYSKSIELFIIANTELTQNQVNQLKNQDWVFVGKQLNGENIVFGYELGLKLKTTSQELSSTDTHGGILLTFDENYANYPMLFTDNPTFDWINYEIISGLTIASGDYVYLNVGVSSDCKIVFPDGSVLSSVSGEAKGYYSGVSGDVLLIVNNTHEFIDFYDSIAFQGAGFAGTLNYTSSKYVDCGGMPKLDGVNAIHSLSVRVDNCPLMAAANIYHSIDNAYSLFLAGNLTGLRNFGGATQAIDTDINSTVYTSKQYIDMIEEMSLAGWTIVYNEI